MNTPGRQMVRTTLSFLRCPDRMRSEREQLEVAYLDLQEKCRPFQVYMHTQYLSTYIMERNTQSCVIFKQIVSHVSVPSTNCKRMKFSEKCYDECVHMAVLLKKCIYRTRLKGWLMSMPYWRAKLPWPEKRFATVTHLPVYIKYCPLFRGVLLQC